MNEKIKLFALRKGSIGDHLWLDGRDPDEEAAVEKFVELIVMECAEQIIIKGTDWIDWMPSQIGVSPEYYEMAQHIKNHFGIE